MVTNVTKMYKAFESLRISIMNEKNKDGANPTLPYFFCGRGFSDIYRNFLDTLKGTPAEVFSDGAWGKKSYVATFEAYANEEFWTGEVTIINVDNTLDHFWADVSRYADNLNNICVNLSRAPMTIEGLDVRAIKNLLSLIQSVPDNARKSIEGVSWSNWNNVYGLTLREFNMSQQTLKGISSIYAREIKTIVTGLQGYMLSLDRALFGK